MRQLTGEVKGMREFHSEELATHAGLESSVVIREGGGEALTGVRIGRVLARDIRLVEETDVLPRTEGNTGARVSKVSVHSLLRGLRPRACAESPRAGTGRSHAWPVRTMGAPVRSDNPIGAKR